MFVDDTKTVNIDALHACFMQPQSVNSGRRFLYVVYLAFRHKKLREPVNSVDANSV